MPMPCETLPQARMGVAWGRCLRAIPAMAPVLALALLLGGCGDSGPVGDSSQNPPPGEPLPPLESGTWFLHSAEGRPVPGVVLTPLPGAGLERTQVDSIRIQIQASGTFGFQSSHVRTEADGSVRNVTTLGSGSWIAEADAYALRLGSSGNELVLAPTADGALEGEHRLPGTLGGATYPVVFRTTRP